MLLRGGRRAPAAEPGADPGAPDAIEADVSGVVADSAPGEGVDDSAIKAEGDSEDIIEMMQYDCATRALL